MGNAHMKSVNKYRPDSNNEIYIADITAILVCFHYSVIPFYIWHVLGHGHGACRVGRDSEIELSALIKIWDCR